MAEELEAKSVPDSDSKNSVTLSVLVAPESTHKQISVLILTPEWHSDTYGTATVTKFLARNLSSVDPKKEFIKITCAVLEEDNNILNDQRVEAAEYGVLLRGAKQPRRGKEQPKLQWLREDITKYYLHLLSEDNYDFIIGHVPYVADGCLNLKDYYVERGHIPKIIFVVYELPRSELGEVDDELSRDWLGQDATVFSLGKSTEGQVAAYIAKLDEGKRPKHLLYIPGYPTELFTVQRQEGTMGKGEKYITMMPESGKNLEENCLDIPLAVGVTTKEVSGEVKVILLAADGKDKDEWERNLEKIQNTQGNLSVQCHVATPIEKLKMFLKNSSLFLLPMKPRSSLFGIEALSAAAAGVPILISRSCGAASLLESMGASESLVNELDVETWRERILQKLQNPEDSQGKANQLRKQLLLDTSIAKTHLDFCQIITVEACAEDKVELDTDPEVSQQGIDMAKKFGVKLSEDPERAKDAITYIVAFFTHLLLHREKITLGLLNDFLNPTIMKNWEELLSSLEQNNRKVLQVSRGSVVFTLYCPTKESFEQLEEKTWTDEITQRLLKLLNELGVQKSCRDPTEANPLPQAESEGTQHKVSALVLTTRWLFDINGISTVTRSLVSNLRTYDPEDKKVQITCAVLEENGKIEQLSVELSDAELHKVKLKGAALPQGVKTSIPETKWMNEWIASYYNHIIKDKKYNFIIGHAPFIAHGAANLRNSYTKEKAPKVALMVHGLPRTEQGELDIEELSGWIKETEIVFLLGETEESILRRYTHGKVLQVYIPTYPICQELISTRQVNRSDQISGKQNTRNITMIVGDKGFSYSEIDFQLALTSSARAATEISARKDGNINMKFVFLTTRKDLKKEFNEQTIGHSHLKFLFREVEGIKEVKSFMEQASVFLLPLRKNFSVFGLEALIAVAAGVPVLISESSGLASVLRNMKTMEKSMRQGIIVKGERDTDSDVRNWKEKIIEKIDNPQKAQDQAEILRRKLFCDVEIAKSHLAFISKITSDWASYDANKFVNKRLERVRVTLGPLADCLDDPVRKIEDSKKHRESSQSWHESKGAGFPVNQSKVKGKKDKKARQETSPIELNDKQLDDIAQHISAKNMKTLAIQYLDFSLSEIEDIFDENKNDLASAKRQILRKWKNKTGKNHCQKLADILQRAATERGLLDYGNVEHIFEVKEA